MQTFCGITTDGMLDYLATIYKLGAWRQRPADKVTTSGLADEMHVSPAAASSMLKRLEESGFIDRSNADGILLTEQGELAALQLIRRHRLLEVFLVEVMGYTWDQVDAEAERMQHAISSAFEERMDRQCGYPSHCPHGDPIPRPDGSMTQETLRALSTLQIGEEGRLRRVSSRDARVLRYLAQLQLVPGQRVALVDKAPFNGPLTLSVATVGDGGGQSQIVGSELAAQLYLVVEPALIQEVAVDGAQAL
ncbi:MAG: metal-dependent transcriptional regulator [Caldilinea sp.]|jgi:DtxR family Mn-dependent transcriptional regulator